MESELWYLVLIPVLFAAGWWARGLDAGERERNSRRLPEAYSRGVAMLMSDRPDKAIDPFIEVVRLDPELIELHHVLGTLFRRRGEFERAIKLHNHLVNREDIPEEDRVKALQALGEDYMIAGSSFPCSSPQAGGPVGSTQASASGIPGGSPRRIRAGWPCS